MPNPPHPSRPAADPVPATGRERLHLAIAMMLVPLSATLWLAAGLTLLFGPLADLGEGGEETAQALLPQVLFWAVPATALALVSVIWFQPRWRASRLPWVVIGALLLAPAALVLA
ncbi:MAG: hypothetical protein U0237_13835 [Thermoleophilia bacterium]